MSVRASGRSSISARRWVKRRNKYDKHFAKLPILKTAHMVLNLCRVSTRQQVANGNLDDLIVKNIERIRAINPTAKIITHTPEGGWCHGWDFHWLEEIAHFAKQDGVVGAGESLSRLVRAKEYHPSRNPYKQPTKCGMRRFKAATGGLPIVLLAGINLTAGEERSVQTKRAPKHGRPKNKIPRKCKVIKSVCYRPAMEMVEQGYSPRRIEKVLAARFPNIKVPTHVTIFRWSKQLVKR